MFSYKAPEQMPQNPVMIEEIDDNMKEFAKNSTVLKDKVASIHEISPHKEFIQKEYTKINSADLGHDTNQTNTHLKKASFEEETKKDEQKATINVILNEDNSVTPKKQNSEICVKLQITSCEEIHIKGLLDIIDNTEQAVKNNSWAPKAIGSNINSPMSKMKVGPEIFVQLQNQNIYDKYSVGTTLGKGFSIFFF